MNLNLSETGTLTISLIIYRHVRDHKVTLVTHRDISPEAVQGAMCEFMELNPRLPRSQIEARFVRTDYLDIPR